MNSDRVEPSAVRRIQARVGRWASNHNPGLFDFLGIDLGEMVVEPRARKLGAATGALAGVFALPVAAFYGTLMRGGSFGEAFGSATGMLVLQTTPIVGAAAGTATLTGSAIGYGIGAGIDRRLGLYEESQDSAYGMLYEGSTALQVRYGLRPDLALTGFDDRYHRIADRDVPFREAICGDVPRLPSPSSD